MLTDKRKGDSSSSQHENKVVKASRSDVVESHIPSTARSEPGNDSAINTDTKIRNSNSPHLVSDPVQPYVSGEISFANHDYPGSEIFSHDNPLKREKSREKDREKGRERDRDRERDRERERDRDSDYRSAPRLPSKVRKSKRRMSFPRQPSAESLEFKVQVPGHISESKIDTKETSPRRGSRGNNGNSKGCVWTEDLDSRLGFIFFLIFLSFHSLFSLNSTFFAQCSYSIYLSIMLSLLSLSPDSPLTPLSSPLSSPLSL